MSTWLACRYASTSSISASLNSAALILSPSIITITRVRTIVFMAQPNTSCCTLQQTLIQYLICSHYTHLYIYIRERELSVLCWCTVPHSFGITGAFLHFIYFVRHCTLTHPLPPLCTHSMTDRPQLMLLGCLLSSSGIQSSLANRQFPQVVV